MTTAIISNYLENKIINHLLRNTAYSATAHVYLALYTSTSSNEDDEGTEVSSTDTGYARVQCPAFTVSAGSATNSSKIEFPLATGDWGTINAVGIRDASTSGNLLFWGALTSPLTIRANETFSISALDLNIYLAGSHRGGWSTWCSNGMLNLVLNNAVFSTPGTNVWMALGHTVIHDDNYNFSSWTELSATGYGRKQVTNWYSPTSGSTTNLSEIVYLDPLAVDWGSITNAVIYNSSTSGNVIWWGRLFYPVWLIAGDGFKFDPGGVDVWID